MVKLFLPLLLGMSYPVYAGMSDISPETKAFLKKFIEDVRGPIQEDINKTLDANVRYQEHLPPPQTPQEHAERPKLNYQIEKLINKHSDLLEKLSKIVDDIETTLEGKSPAKTSAVSKKKQGDEEAKSHAALKEIFEEGETAWKTLKEDISQARLEKAPLLIFLTLDARVVNRMNDKDIRELLDQGRYCTLNELLAVFYHLNEPLINRVPGYALTPQKQDLLERIKIQIFERKNMNKNNHDTQRMKTIQSTIERGSHKSEAQKISLYLKNYEKY